MAVTVSGPSSESVLARTSHASNARPYDPPGSLPGKRTTYGRPVCLS